MKHHDITIYTSTSHYSDLTKEYFRQASMDFEEFEVRQNPKYADEAKMISGQPELPVTIIDGRTVVGFKPDLFEIILGQSEKENEK